MLELSLSTCGICVGSLAQRTSRGTQCFGVIWHLVGLCLQHVGKIQAGEVTGVAQRKATEMLLWAHEQLIRSDRGMAMEQLPPAREAKPGGAGISSILPAHPSLKHRPALLAADTNIGKHVGVPHALWQWTHFLMGYKGDAGAVSLFSVQPVSVYAHI